MRHSALFVAAILVGLAASAPTAATAASLLDNSKGFPDAPQGGGHILAGQSSFDSSSGNSGDPFRGGEWSNSANGQAWAALSFDQVQSLTSISVEMAGTDVTSDGSYIGLQVLSPTNVWETVYEVAGVVINRDFLPGKPVRKVGPQTVILPNVKASAVRLIMKGHGWFAARNIVVSGE